MDNLPVEILESIISRLTLASAGRLFMTCRDFEHNRGELLGMYKAFGPDAENNLCEAYKSNNAPWIEYWAGRVSPGYRIECAVRFNKDLKTKDLYNYARKYGKTRSHVISTYVAYGACYRADSIELIEHCNKMGVVYWVGVLIKAILADNYIACSHIMRYVALKYSANYICQEHVDILLSRKSFRILNLLITSIGIEAFLRKSLQYGPGIFRQIMDYYASNGYINACNMTSILRDAIKHHADIVEYIRDYMATHN